MHFDSVPSVGADAAAAFLDTTGTALDFDNERILLVLVRDMTMPQSLVTQLRASDRLVSIGMLAAGVADEINNPLSSILLNVELALDQLGDLAQTNPTKVIADLRDELEDARGAAEHVAANEGRLGQALLNLIVNAGQSIAEGDADDNEIAITTRKGDDGFVFIDIEDTGCGISPDGMSRLFAWFCTTKRPGVGTGLGLSMSRAIVRAAGGEITVSNRARRGAVFTIRLTSEQMQAASEEPAQRRSRAVATRSKVLVVDDDLWMTVTVSRALQRDYDVVTETNGAAALERLSNGERFAAIVSDLVMPSISGEEFYNAVPLLDRTQAERFIFLTGASPAYRGRSFLASVSQQTVEKPFNVDTIRSSIEHLGPAASIVRKT